MKQHCPSSSSNKSKDVAKHNYLAAGQKNMVPKDRRLFILAPPNCVTRSEGSGLLASPLRLVEVQCSKGSMRRTRGGSGSRLNEMNRELLISITTMIVGTNSLAKRPQCGVYRQTGLFTEGA